MNKVILMGRLAKDPEIKQTSVGKYLVSNITLAVQNDFPDKDGEYRCQFIQCTAFNGLAEFIEKWFKKGKPILVEGRLDNSSYKDKEGNTRYVSKVIVEKANFCLSEPKEEKQTYNRRK
jgi:single-strand DNA-binding protein|nr:MAG TPA: Single strand binding protein [Caudoviricetes sp.]